MDVVRQSYYRWLPGQRFDVWSLCLLLVGASLLLARSAESVSYTAMQQSVEAKTHAQTIRDARAFLRRFPQSLERAQVMFWLAEALYATQAYQDAATVYRELLRQTPAFPQAAMALRHLGLSDLHCRRYNAALATFTQLLERFPGFKERDHIVFHMATVYFKQGRFEEALPLYQQLQKAHMLPVSVAALHLRLADGYFHVQQFEPAQQHYRLILQSFPTSPEAPLAHYQLGAVALVQQEFEVARHHFQTMVHTYAPGAATVRAHYGLAWTLYYQGQARRAVAYLKQRNLLAQPSAADAVLARSYDLVRLRVYHKAIPLLTWRLGRNFMELGQYAEARDYLLEVLTTYATEPLATQRYGRTNVTALASYREGLILKQAESLPAAVHALHRAAQQVAEQFPDQQDWTLTALFRAGEIYEALQQYQDAISIYQRIVTANPHDRQGQYAAERVKHLKAKCCAPQLPTGFPSRAAP